MQSFLDGRVVLHLGDCVEVMKTLPENSVDSVVCDPPYHLVQMTKRYGKEDARPCGAGNDGSFRRLTRGFMGKQWDGGDVAFRPETWAVVLRLLKPGGHLLAFSGTRTYHRMTVAIEDAGFEIRDQIGWVFASGFPKSHNIGNGWGTALKPAWEPICLARKPLIGTVAETVLACGTGAINIDACRIDYESASDMAAAAAAAMRGAADQNAGRNAYGQFNNGAATIAPYLQKMNGGRWPANLCHDGSEEVLALFPESDGQQAEITFEESNAKTGHIYGKMSRHGEKSWAPRSDSGSAARFFYTAKADSGDRLGSKHPTVKPLDLMQWLCRLVTPKGGTVLDPFAGTGTTGEAAWREGFRAILIEREAEYQADIARRMDLAHQPTKRDAVAKTKNNLDDPNLLPLFAGIKE